MSINKTPVCPFCNKEMKKQVDFYIIPTNINRIYVEIDTKRIDVRSPDGELLAGISNQNNLNAWECVSCGFVALWEGAVK